MRGLAVGLAAAALAIAPAAHAEEACKLMQDVVREGLTDKSFAAFRPVQPPVRIPGGVRRVDRDVRATRQVDGFECRVLLYGDRNFFDCDRTTAGDAYAEVAALSARLEKWLKVRPDRRRDSYSSRATFTIRATPNLYVYVAGTRDRQVYLKVVAH
jgi:hypothetical protein